MCYLAAVYSNLLVHRAPLDLQGNEALTFTGHEYRAPFECRGDLETLDLDAVDALIVPSGMVADRLRDTDDLARLPLPPSFCTAPSSGRDWARGSSATGSGPAHRNRP